MSQWKKVSYIIIRTYFFNRYRHLYEFPKGNIGKILTEKDFVRAVDPEVLGQLLIVSPLVRFY